MLAGPIERQRKPASVAESRGWMFPSCARTGVTAVRRDRRDRRGTAAIAAAQDALDALVGVMVERMSARMDAR
jgi:hypothetical protein